MAGKGVRAARRLVLGVALVCASALVSAQGRTARRLDIYVIDVEGGNATLVVAPSGESLLIDSGNTGAGAVRDATRIVSAAKNAGLSRIDHVITTHWHGDHYGGLAEVAARMPIAHFVDHGANIQPTEATTAFLRDIYPGLYAKGTHTVAKADDTIPLGSVGVRVVSSDGQVLRTPLVTKAQPNPLCGAPATVEAVPEDRQSVGVAIAFGRFRALHLGDLTKDKEWEMVCPDNRIGTVDVLLGMHHGQDTSSPEALVHAVRPRVAVINNGTRKGALPGVMRTLYSSPGFEDVWQLHVSLLTGQEYTAPGVFIANDTDEPTVAVPVVAAPPPPTPGTAAPAPPAHNGQAYWVKVSAQEDGTFSVTNQRNGFFKTYEPTRR